MLAIDLDGTILRDEYPDCGEPIPNIAKELSALRDAGWVVIVWTVRHHVKDVQAHLDAHKIPYDYINENPWGPAEDKSRKMYADVYVDDRAINFDGDASGLASKVVSFKPWHKRNPITGH